MSDVSVIRIEILGDASEEDSSGSNKKTSKNVSKELYKIMHPVGNYLKKKMGDQAYSVAQKAYSQTKQTVLNYANSQFNRYTTLKEDYLARNTLNAVKTSINKVSSAGSTILGDAMAGATVAGPTGAAVGAIVGAISFGINQYIDYQTRMSSYYQSLNATNYQTQFAAFRAGLVNNSQGTEN